MKNVAVLGFSYKPLTSDTRDSPAIGLVIQLLSEGALVSIYDPQADADCIMTDLIQSANHGSSPRGAEKVQAQVTVRSDLYAATMGAHAVVVATEWEQFGTKSNGCDWRKIYNEMTQPAWVFDGRNFLDRQVLNTIGFRVDTIGLPSCGSPLNPWPLPQAESDGFLHKPDRSSKDPLQRAVSED